MLAEIKAEATSSAYTTEIAKITKEAFCMSADLTGAKALHAKKTFLTFNRNVRQRMASKPKGKGQEQLTGDEPDIKPLMRAKHHLEDRTGGNHFYDKNQAVAWFILLANVYNA